MMNLEAYSVVTIPFPFSDQKKEKRRPALVISSPSAFNNVIGHSVMAMITSSKNSPWPLDVEILDLSSAGLPAASTVRMKLFSLDHRLVVATLGKLSPKDTKSVQAALSRLLLRS